MVGVLHGLHAAHEANNEFGEPLGIVHRDVSPQNVIVGVDGVPRVVDFGVAKAMGQAHETRGRELKGKLRYMAPEQARGATVTRLTDVWAAGVVFFEILSGKSLFGGDNDALILKNVVSAPIPDLADYAPGAPPALDAIVKKALSRFRRVTGSRPRARWRRRSSRWRSPLALPSEVGAYVERMCGDSIAKRAEQIKDVESASRTHTGAIIPTAEFIADTLWRDLPGKSLTPAPGPTSASAPAHGPAPARARAPAPALPPAPALAKPFAAPPKPPSRARWVVPSGVFATLGLLLLVGGPMLVPGYAKQKAVQAAAARGVTLAIGSASGGYSSVHLHHLTVSLPDVAGVTAEVADVVVDLVVVSADAREGEPRRDRRGRTRRQDAREPHALVSRPQGRKRTDRDGTACASR